MKSTSAEHTIFKVSKEVAQNNPLKLGERVMMVPFYSDATMLLHRQAYAVRNGTVEVRTNHPSIFNPRQNNTDQY